MPHVARRVWLVTVAAAVVVVAGLVVVSRTGLDEATVPAVVPAPYVAGGEPPPMPVVRPRSEPVPMPVVPAPVPVEPPTTMPEAPPPPEPSGG